MIRALIALTVPDFGFPETAILNHDALISAIYAGAAGETDWAEIPNAVCDVFGAGAMLFADGYVTDKSSYRIAQFNYGEDVLADCGLTVADNFDPNLNPCFRACTRARLNESFEGGEIFHGETERQRDFFEHCFVRRGIASTRLFTVMREGGAVAGGFIARPTAAGPMDAADVARFDGMLSHLRRATDMRLRLEIGRAALSSLAEIIDHRATAVLLVDRNLRIVFRNAVAETMLAGRSGVSAFGRTFRLADPAAHALLLARLGDLYADGAVPTETPIRAKRQDGLPPLAVSVYRATGMSAATGAHAAHACIVIGDPCDEGGLPTAERLQAALGLTRAEANVLRLTPLALSRRQMADRLGVAESTVKTHLARGREKLGARSTAALGQIMTRVGLR